MAHNPLESLKTGAGKWRLFSGKGPEQAAESEDAFGPREV